MRQEKFCLRDLVAPQPVHDFLQNTYGQSWVHYKGDASRFDHLADWDTLNTLVVDVPLAGRQSGTPQLRLAKQGNILPAEDYTEPLEAIGGNSSRRVVVDRLTDELRQGATLVIDRADEAHGPIRRLAATLEFELKAPVSINAIASWMPVPGFDLHWDPLDTFIIQLDGRKSWAIFEPTRKWPFWRDIVGNPKPDSPPVAEFDLTAGDVLYLPQGWWHLVTAVGEPSLQLTVIVTPNNGIDLLKWLVDRSMQHEIFRKRIPRFADTTQQEEYLFSVREAWGELMNSKNVLEEFFAYADGTSRSRPLFSFPGLYETNTVLQCREARIILLAPRATVVPDVDGCVLKALGRRWKFPMVTKPLIDVIVSMDDVTVERAIAANVGVSEERSANVIFALLRAGVLALQCQS